jgi:hypothetical protein
MRKLATCAAYAAAVAVMLASAPQADAQCANGLIVNCPPAVNPQPDDVIYLYQLAQNPHSRSITLGAIEAGGSVTVSLSLIMPNIFNVTGSPATASGTFDVVLATEAPNTFLAGTASGTTSVIPTFRAIQCSDQPALTGAVSSNTGSCFTSLNTTVSFSCNTMPALTGFISTTASSCTTTLTADVTVAEGGSGASTSNSARVNLNQGYFSPSTAASTITPACTSSTMASNVFIIQLQSGVGPYTLANCNPPPATGVSFVALIQQPTSGSTQSISSYGSKYLFEAPYSNASPPSLSHTLSSTDSLFCVAFSTATMVCTFIPFYS